MQNNFNLIVNEKSSYVDKQRVLSEKKIAKNQY